MSESKGMVLIVEDEVRILRFLQASLRAVGYKVTTAASGEEGLKLVEQAKPDIVLLDIVMSPMDGFEVLRRLRSSSKVPVIAMSAHASAREEAMKLGADSFVGKPFSPDIMAKEIQTLLDRNC